MNQNIEGASDLKIEIWAPVLAVIFIAGMTTLIIWRVKRANAKVTKNSVRSDPNARENLDDTDYENYGSNIHHRESNYSQPYATYDDEYEEYGDQYAEYKKPEKGFRQSFQVFSM